MGKGGNSHQRAVQKAEEQRMGKPEKPTNIVKSKKESIFKQIWSWVVIGAFVLFLWAGGISFMLTPHPLAADFLFGLGSLLIVTKFVTWEDARNDKNRNSIMVFACLITFGITGSAMWWNHKINPEPSPAGQGLTSPTTTEAILPPAISQVRDDVFDKLTFSYKSMPDGKGNPNHAVFTVTNGSKYEISKKHQLRCDTVLEVGMNGTVVSKNGISATGPGNQLLTGNDIPHLSWDFPMKPYDSMSVPCLSLVTIADPECTDVLLSFWFSLESQPEIEQVKQVRYLGLTKGGDLEWFPMALHQTTSVCESHIKIKQPG